VLLSAASYGSARYTDLRRIQPIHGDVKAGADKAAVCFSCHGADGVPVAPTFPRLAGQRADYLYHRLFSFRHADPKDPYYSVSPMTGMATTLSDVDMRDLAVYFASQTPAAPDTLAAAAAAVPDGEGLFLHGDPARGIPPCQGCHGADANGPPATDQYAAYPALRGQNALYLVARLTSYRTGLPSDTSNALIMHGVAQTLDDDSIQAVAAWLGSLVPRKTPLTQRVAQQPDGASAGRKQQPDLQ
jgi:cytochrome c553